MPLRYATSTPRGGLLPPATANTWWRWPEYTPDAAPSIFAFTTTVTVPDVEIGLAETSPPLEISDFGYDPIHASDTVNSITVEVNHYVSDTAAFTGISYELWDARGTQIGVTQAGTVSTDRTNVDRATFNSPAASSCTDLRVRLYANSHTTHAGAVWNVDAVQLVLDVTLAPSVSIPTTPVLGAATLPAPAITAEISTGSVSVTAVPVLTHTDIPSTTASASTVITATSVQATAALPAVAPHAGATAIPTPATAVVALPAVSITSSVVITASPIVATLAQPQPIITAQTFAEAPTVELSGFGDFAGITETDTIQAVTVRINQYATSASMGPATFQLWDGTTAQIGDTHECTTSTSTSNVDTATFTGLVTYAQLADLRLRINTDGGTAPSGEIWSINWATITVDYSPTTVDASIGATPIQSVTAFATPSVLAGATAVPTAILAVATLPAAAASGVISRNITVTPVLATAGVPTPTATAGTLIAAASITASTTLPAVSVRRDSAVIPSVITASAVIPVPTASGQVVTHYPGYLDGYNGPEGFHGTPSAVVATLSVPVPSVRQDWNLTATPILGLATVPTVAIGTAANVQLTATPVAATAAIPTVTITYGQNITVASVIATVVISAPDISGTATVNITAIPILAAAQPLQLFPGAYAMSATDLADGAGTWATPDGATGGNIADYAVWTVPG